MERRIGATLRQTRMRREIELAEVEVATRIRLKYLRAIEGEDWDALPEGVYARGFIRTYASFLGLDGERLAEDYRREVEGVDPSLAADAPGPRRLPVRGPGRPLGMTALAIAGVLAVAALVLVALPLAGGGGGSAPISHPEHAPMPAPGGAAKPQPKPTPDGVSMRLTATAEVWVCVLDGAGEPLVQGQVLDGGAEMGPFRSGSFTVSFGNGGIIMLVDGREADIPATASPIGYSVDASGHLTPLSESERPTCT